MRALVLALALAAPALAQDTFEAAKALYEQGTEPAGPKDITGWWAGRWLQDDLPGAKGGLLGVEGVPSKREDPASDPVLILATWSDRDPQSWDDAKPAELTRSQDMLRRGPRDGVIVFDAQKKAAVILGRYDDGKFRYEYAIRRAGDKLVLRYDYEHRKVSYGVYAKKVMEAAP